MLYIVFAIVCCSVRSLLGTHDVDIQYRYINLRFGETWHVLAFNAANRNIYSLDHYPANLRCTGSLIANNILSSICMQFNHGSSCNSLSNVCCHDFGDVRLSFPPPTNSLLSPCSSPLSLLASVSICLCLRVCVC